MRGFTLVELMITLSILAAVLLVLSNVLYTAMRSKTQTVNLIESSQAGRVAMDLIARDLRSAGYGADLTYTMAPQPPIAYIDSLQLLINANLTPYPDTTGGMPGAPLAYDPAGSPRPRPLVGTSWTPPTKYRTGAEIVRWTLDLNDDGSIDSGDLNTTAGADARRTPVPDDFVLVRQVYGDSTNNVAGNNGGAAENIALIRRPGASGVPALFTVYLRGQTVPWDWAGGPVPANQLQNIERVQINVVAPSPRPDSRGQYAETRYSTEVNSLRNIPDIYGSTYIVNGYVFHDVNENGAQDTGEPGVPGASVYLGSQLSTTSSTGYFSFNASAGNYVLRQVPPAGWGVMTSPDTFVVVVPPATTRSFADTVIAGGMVTFRVFEDTDADGVKDSDTSEPWRSSVEITILPSGLSDYTDENGRVQMFAKTGAYTATIAVPDSFNCLSSNPVARTMTSGGTDSVAFRIDKGGKGKVRGNVWHDRNNNGIKDGKETGVGNVWVGVISSFDNVLSFDYTGSDGNYEIEVPQNDPPRTNPYSIEVLPPAGYYASTSAIYTDIWVANGITQSGLNFGLNSFQMITLNASRVLSLDSGDLMEKDWPGNSITKAHADKDILLGADANGTDQLSVWFNQYDGSPLFNEIRDFARTAPNAVLALAAAPLNREAAPFTNRVDVVTGTRNAAAGNIFIWFAQGTSGNEGYVPSTYHQAYRTADNGDVTAVVAANVTTGAGLDIIVGTKSPTAGEGTIEVWVSNDANTPTFSRVDTYPPTGNIPGGRLGEITAMALSPFRGSTTQDLVVTTRTGDYTGQIAIFSRVDSAGIFKLRWLKDVSDGAPTSLTVADVTDDGKPDITVGLQTGVSTGRLDLWKNECGASLVKFTLNATRTLSTGYPLCLTSGDMGGVDIPDIIMGWRSDPVGYGGGVLIWYCDAKTLPTDPVDPSEGMIVNMVPALTVGNFNYGVNPVIPLPPFLTDFAAGVKSSASTGALVVFIR